MRKGNFSRNFKFLLKGHIWLSYAPRHCDAPQSASIMPNIRGGRTRCFGYLGALQLVRGSSKANTSHIIPSTVPYSLGAHIFSSRQLITYWLAGRYLRVEFKDFLRLNPTPGEASVCWVNMIFARSTPKKVTFGTFFETVIFPKI